MFLLDTNVVSEGRRRNAHPRLVRWLRAADADTLFLSVLTLGEIAKGAARLAARDPRQHDALRSWLETVRSGYTGRILPIDEPIAEAWGSLAARRPLPVIDGLIAATAVVHDLTLVTRNVRDGADLGVRVLDPWEA
jgi:hypothetical protein